MTATADPAAAVFQRHSRWDDMRAGDFFREFEYTTWLAGQCPICEEGGRGPECTPHAVAEETAAKRREDY